MHNGGGDSPMPVFVAHVSSAVPYQRQVIVVHADALVVPETRSIDDRAWDRSARHNHEIHAVITNPDTLEEDLRETAFDRRIDVVWHRWTVTDVVDHIRARTEQPRIRAVVAPAEALQISKRQVDTEIVVRYGARAGQVAVAKL